MDMTINFLEDKKVSVEYRGHTIYTDQPRTAGGDGSAPAPFDLLLASIGTCAGFYVQFFCRKRSILIRCRSASTRAGNRTHRDGIAFQPRQDLR